MASNASLSECVGQVGVRVLAILGPATYPTLAGTERWPAGEISDAVLDADIQVQALVVGKRAEGRRVPFLLTALVATGGTLPSHAGEIDSVSIGGIQAIRGDPVRIQRDRDNPQNIPVIPKFNLEGNTLYHNGKSTNNLGTNTALVVYADITRGTVSLGTPSEYSGAVIALATAMVLPKAGNHVDAGGFYQKLYESYVMPISRGERDLAPLPTTEEVRRSLPPPQQAA